MELTKEDVRSLVKAVWVAVGSLVICAFSIGVYMTDIRSQVIGIGQSVIELKDKINSMPPTWVALAIQRNAEELKRQQVSIDRIEAGQAGNEYDGRGYDGTQ